MRALLRRILDLICPPIAANELLPWGLSRAKDGPLATDIIRLLLPLAYWHGERHVLTWDAMRRGWWLTSIMVAVLRTPGGFDIRIRTGSHPRGNGALRTWRGPQGWYEERAFLDRGEYVKVGEP